MNHLKKILLALGILTLTACSGGSSSNWLQGVQFSNNNGSLQVSLTAKVDTAQISLNPVFLQFFHPNVPTQLFGSIDITNVSSSETDITFTYDFPTSTQLSQLTNLATTNALPNGTAVPITGPNQIWQLVQEFAGTGSLIYLNSSPTAAVIGYVLQSDQLSSGSLGNLLMNYALDGLSGGGVAGIFSGTSAGTSGFALFADLSSLLGTATNGMPKIVDFTPENAKVQILRHLYELNQEHARITVK